MNRLANETSPYLLQHADNPVDWHPWDEQALELARRDNKPILLSIGYSACHWCHVMAHESFESVQVAQLMNEHFVNIKVDREERPDLDRIYQAAHQVLTRQGGGWPLTMFLDPHDHLPFYGGTYFPPQPNEGRPGFRQVLKDIGAAYSSQGDKLKDFKDQLRDALSSILGSEGSSAPGEPDATMVDRACGQIDASFDAGRGGFSESPKFPHPAGLELLLDAAANEDPQKAERAAHMLDFTLTAMARGGVFDHLGGGFFRYSVDAEWTIPHFEKMLYDNGPLLSLYARRGSQPGATEFRSVAERTADWMIREMQLPEGGICSSLDADSEGAEGAFYVWNDAHVRDVVGADVDAFAAAYGLDDSPNFEKKWHLRLPAPDPEAAGAQDDPAAELDAARTRLLAERETRERPGRDDKVLASWNALAIRGLADAGRCLGREDYLDAACRAVDYLRSEHWRDGALRATSRNGEARLNAYLDDYAFLIDALLVLLSARWRDADLQFAMALADAMLAHFEDREHGGFFFTSDDHEALIQRLMSFSDDSLPSGNGTAVRALLELGHLVGETRYLDAAERALRAGLARAERWPSAHATLMRALLDFTQPPARLVLRSRDTAAAADWAGIAADRLPLRSRCYVIPDDADTPPGLLAAQGVADGANVTAYFCRGQQCSAPASDRAAFEQNLETA